MQFFSNYMFDNQILDNIFLDVIFLFKIKYDNQNAIKNFKL